MDIGQVLGEKYRIVNLLGEGGMGKIYAAEHLLLSRKVAIKVLHESHTSNPKTVERFLREAQAASAIGHPNIVEIYDIGKQDNSIYMVMELLRGRDLSQELKKEGRFPLGRAVGIMMQVLSALHAAHAKGIVHRDLKPDNIFIAYDARRREEVKLLDFGVAKVVGDGGPNKNLTMTGSVLGTPTYMSPEQARGTKHLDHRTDIWSCGVIFYVMLTGSLPFDGENYNEVLSKILLEHPPSLEKLIPELSKEFVEAVERAMAKSLDERYYTVTEMMEALMPFHTAKSDSISPRALLAIGNSIAPSSFLDPLSEFDLGDEEPPNILDISPIRYEPTIPSDECEPDDAQSADPPEQADIETPVEVPVAPMGTPTVAPPDKKFSQASLAAVFEDSIAHKGKWSLVRARFGKNRWISLSAIGGGLLMIALAIGFVLPNREKEKQPIPVKTSKITRKIVTEPPTGNDNELAAPEKVVETPRLVKITVEGTAPNSILKLEGETVESPFTAESSDAPLTLEVEADGYEMVVQKFLPDQDKLIKIEMKPLQKRNLKRRPVKKVGKKPRKKKSSGDFADSPF